MTRVKLFLLLALLLGSVCAVRAQEDTAGIPPAVSAVQNDPQPVRRRIPDTSQYEYADSVLRSRNAIAARLLRDSLLADLVRKAALPVTPAVVYDTTTYAKYATHSFLPSGEPVYMIIDYRKQGSKDDLFYLMAGIVFVLAFIRAAFSKYFRNLFLLFLQTSLTAEANTRPASTG
jgi:hypothetical protein